MSVREAQMTFSSLAKLLTNGTVKDFGREREMGKIYFNVIAFTYLN